MSILQPASTSPMALDNIDYSDSDTFAECELRNIDQDLVDRWDESFRLESHIKEDPSFLKTVEIDTLPLITPDGPGRFRFEDTFDIIDPIYVLVNDREGMKRAIENGIIADKIARHFPFAENCWIEPIIHRWNSEEYGESREALGDEWETVIEWLVDELAGEDGVYTLGMRLNAMRV